MTPRTEPAEVSPWDRLIGALLDKPTETHIPAV